MVNLNSDHCCTELQRILDQCIECTGRLEDLLHDERTSLELQDADNLRAITTSKELCVRCLESLDAERQALCANAGYDAGEAGMGDLLKWCDKHSMLVPVWKRLLQGAKQCEAMNRTNGAIGRVRYEHIMSALVIFNGGDGGNSLYDPEGLDSPDFTPRALARA